MGIKMTLNMKDQNSLRRLYIETMKCVTFPLMTKNICVIPL
jgi:hypothetical protein